MNTQNKNLNPSEAALSSVDPLTRDFIVSSLVVSVLVNLAVFVSWLTVTLA